MSLERTQQTMNHYFEVMGRGGDFAEFYTADVTWTHHRHWAGRARPVFGSRLHCRLAQQHVRRPNAEDRRLGWTRIS
jgi:hypothetical protein